MSHTDAALDLGAPARRTRPAGAALGAGIAAAAVLLAVLGWSLTRSSIALQPGRPAPDVAIETFDGATVDLRGLRGRVVVVNFWASWCLPCAEEAADLEALWRDYRDRGVTVLGVAYTDTRPAALAYLARHGVTYPNGMDRGGAAARRYGVRGVPETVVVDALGRLADLRPAAGAPEEGIGRVKLVGPITPSAAFTPTDLRATVERLLAGSAP